MSRYSANIITRNPATPTGPATTGRAPGIWRMDDVAYWIRQGVWPNPAIVPDPQFPYVSLLLSTTSLGNANNNLFVDSSGAFNPVSRNGNTTQGSFTPYATNWSNYFDGAGDYLSIPYSVTTTEWWTQDFTMEMWVFNNTNAVSGTNALCLQLAHGVFNAASTYWSFGTNASGQVDFYYFNGGPNRVTSSTAAPLNTWNHIAMVYTHSTGNISLYLNGVSVASGTKAGTPQNSNTNTVNIGVAQNTYYNGYISNVRILDGTALYTGTFTPPTAPLTAITNTALLTCQSNRFRDASTNNFTVTPNGNASVQDFGPFSPAYPGAAYNQSDITNWSGFFNGGTDRVQVPVTSNMYLGTTYTIEAWAYYNSTSYGARPIFSECEAFQGGFAGLTLTLNTSGNLVAEYRPATSGAVTTITGPTVTPYTWFHIALVSNNSSAKLYVNGTQVGSTTTFGDYPSAKTAFVAVGSWGHGWNDGGIPAAAWIGYISNMRVVKGVAVYTSNFTPSTTPLTAISGTVLLTCQNAAFTDNSSVNNILTPVSNATVTGNSPFNTVGYWSNYFDGTGDYLTLPDNAALEPGSSDLTWEMWINTSNSTQYATLYSRTTASFTSGMWSLMMNLASSTAGDVGLYVGDFNTGAPLLQTTGVNVRDNLWHHIAVVRNGSAWVLYVDGVSRATATWSGTIADISGGPSIARDQFYTRTYLGYISNLRIVKGTAVYTSAFTPPTTPLTAITNTSLLTCQASRLIDSSTNNFTITRNGDVSVQSFDPFYSSTIASNGGSMYFDGSGDYLALQSNPNYALGSGDFTLEVWVYPIVQGGHGSGNNDCIIDFRPAANGAYGTLYSFNSGASINWYANTGVRITGAAIPNNSWSHLCVSRVSGNTRLFINGVQSGSTYVDSTNYLQTDPWIGQFHDGVGSGWFQGYMSGMRIVKGSGVSSTFTPPTAPQTPTAATTLLLNGMNAGIYDATTINDMETIGNAQVRNITPFLPANYYAGYFDGSGDYLATGTSSAIALGTSDFTYECWVYPSSYPNDSTLVYAGGTSTGNEISLQIRNSQVAAHLYISGVHSDVQFTDLAPALNQWSHLAISRVSGVLYGFLNGVRSATAPALTTNFGTSAAAYVAVGNRYAGSISNARITKNVAVYSTATYTVPTSPLEASANTAFLTCQNKTFIDNSPNALPITVYGGATAGVSGPFTYTGATSVYFDGSGDYLVSRGSTILLGSGNFTVEFWVYFNAVNNSTVKYLYDFRTASATSASFLAQEASNAWTYWNGAGSSVTTGLSGSTFATGQWYHVAITRSSNVLYCFVNGTKVSSDPADSSNYASATMTLGARYSGSDGLNGYIDDVRLTAGVARYTANFTPPTQAFPTY